MSLKHAFKKGRRAEKEICEILNENGLSAKVIPVYLNDMRPGGADIFLEERFNIQVKHREALPEYLWEWLMANDFLVLRKNRKVPLVVMTLGMFVEYFKNGIKQPTLPKAMRTVAMCRVSPKSKQRPSEDI